ncbi:hypothetical protein H0H87_001736 [Tephrocybe sp. NHM501043]|nr:hypothetical protein H0H87_001736 [Tephrocybe sp. NHM501043]
MDITSHVSPAFSSSCYTVSPSSPASIQSEKISVDVLTLSQTVNSAGGLSLDTNAHSKVWRRIDIHIIPVVAMFYLLSFLDRTNLANARVAGLQADLGLSNYQYCIALTVTFIPYIIIEIPSNLVLKKRLHIGSNPTSSKGGVYPGLVLYLSFWYPRHQLQRRISAFFSTASLSGAFSSLLAYGIINLDGVANHPGWAWIFILEGLFTVLFGIFAFWALPRNPEDARWLSEGERKWVVRMVLEGEGKEEKKDGDEEGEERFKWEQVGRVFAAPQMWMLAVLFFLNGVCSLFTIAFANSLLKRDF